eukprot:6330031-Prymnesium_polylepis.1
MFNVHLPFHAPTKSVLSLGLRPRQPSLTSSCPHYVHTPQFSGQATAVPASSILDSARSVAAQPPYTPTRQSSSISPHMFMQDCLRHSAQAATTTLPHRTCSARALSLPCQQTSWFASTELIEATPER